MEQPSLFCFITQVQQKLVSTQDRASHLQRAFDDKLKELAEEQEKQKVLEKNLFEAEEKLGVRESEVQELQEKLEKQEQETAVKIGSFKRFISYSCRTILPVI